MQTLKITPGSLTAMNVLVDYSSDSDSEQESSPGYGKVGTTAPRDSIEDDFVRAALNDLQSFAASVENDPTKMLGEGKPSQQPVVATHDPDPEDLKFLSFLKEIDAIPDPSTDHTQARPPTPPPPTSPEPQLPPPPPPPPPPTEALALFEEHDSWNGSQSTLASVQEIQARLLNLSLLPVPSIDQKDLQRRLLEFAIRTVDWEKGGLEETYFLGKDRAEAILARQGSETATDGPLPPFGGIVGSMIKRLYELEQMATPYGWMPVWDAEDEAYGFQHIRTGAYSSVYPSIELQHYFDPTASLSKLTHTFRNNNNGSYFNSHSSTYLAKAANPTVATESVTPPSATQSNSASSVSVASKRKRRKAEESVYGQQMDTDPFSDQHIHPSRRAVLTNKPPGSSQPSMSAPGSSSAKSMPKRMANLLQKWSEKDMESSSDEEENSKEGDQSRVDASTAMSGANSQNLGSDWRDRRLYPHK
ncbi:hypothetical protein BG011_004859 [Mortierella polycephala]|uniref:Uncharacterized protein n=1 Tax=Mortierella polycephala TaxID=41804 RepID=A0A9P6Q0N0_9FUNG|nr:hypothetical protein BG011_004859 [Mortierella polycephala]